MWKGFKVIHNQEGSIMLVALLMMALLTIIGVSALDISEMNNKIASNDRVFKKNFYLAEAATLEATSILRSLSPDEIGPGATSPPVWLSMDRSLDLTNLNNWVVDDPTPSNNTAIVADIDDRTRYSAIYEGIPSGASLDMSASQVHQYDVFGLYNDTAGAFKGQVMIKIGFLRRF